MFKDKTILIKEKKECAGCGACMVECPVSAIKMVEDNRGCYYPQIDEAKCISCGKCLFTCVYGENIPDSECVYSYAAKSTNCDILESSASGGVFATLSVNALRKRYDIAGAVYKKQERLDICHILSNSIDGIKAMQGSKYAHSRAWDCFCEIKKTLRAGNKVLFCGTPCQVAAIKRITNNPDNLITIDLICHGVPSARMLQDYLDILSNSLHEKVSHISFRDKKCKKDFCAGIILDSKRKKLNVGSHYLSYYYYFLRSAIYRENCYSCPYAKMKRISDITIGDYWGIADYHKDDIGEDTKDWSAVIINTEKGMKFFNDNNDGLTLIKTEKEWIANSNMQLHQPSKKPNNRDVIVNAYEEHGYVAVENMYEKMFGGKIRYKYLLLKEIYLNKRKK